MNLRAFECNVRGKDWKHTVHAQTAGKARYEYWRDLHEAWPDIPFTAVTCHVSGPATSSEAFRNTALYRHVPFAYVGMRVIVGNWRGVLAGVNSSANFDVIFEDGPHVGQKLNCHPNHEMAYFGDNGEVLADFRRNAA